jgi:hypothetical protein
VPWVSRRRITGMTCRYEAPTPTIGLLEIFWSGMMWPLLGER